MNKIYVSDNYIIVEQDGIIKPFPRGKAEYNEATDHFIIRKYPNKDIVVINFENVSGWMDESGAIPYSIGSLRTFFRQNTGFEIASWSSGAEFIKQSANNYSSLLDGELVGDIAYVRNAEGTQWLPGSLWGTYYPEGWYEWNGTVWVADNDAFANQFYLNQEQLDNKAEVVDLQTEAQTRLNNDNLLQGQLDFKLSTNETFEQFLGYVKSLDPNPVFSYTSSLLTSIAYSHGGNTTTLTLNYDVNNILTSLVLGGFVATGIPTIKTLNYDVNGILTNITYS